MKVLAVLGSSEGIDTESDRTYLETILGKDRVKWLEQPDRQRLNESLWEKKWDIFFFAGHSSSRDETGKIELNATESISIFDLKFAMQNAVKNGLKLAIFNSCDGLGLARDLAELKIPHTIVMREPVPDEVAHKFLRYFLELFSQGVPLHKAVKQAREKLQGLERDIPCASWLPIIYETPGCLPITWSNPANISHKIKLTLGAILLLTTTLSGVWFYTEEQKRTSDQNRIVELANQQRISYGTQLLFPDNTNSEKVKGSKSLAIGDCVSADRAFRSSLSQAKNDPETLIYYNNSSACNKDIFKIAVSVPIGSNPNIAREILRGVAQKQDEINRNGGINGKLIKIQIANDDNDVEIAQGLAAKFASDRGTLAVIGHNASDASVAACPLYDKNKLVMITPTSFSNNLSSCGDYIFRSVPNIYFLAKKIADYITAHQKQAVVGICVDRKAIDNESFATTLQSILNDDSHRDRTVMSRFNCDLSKDNFDAEKLIATAKKERVNTIILAPHVDRINRALEVARASQGKFALYASPTLYTNLTLASKYVDRTIISVPWHPTAIKANNFTQNARKLWGDKVDLTWRTAFAYDALLVIAKTLPSSNTREEIQQTLSDRNFSAEGATGKIEFSPSGDRNGKAYLVRVQKKPNSDNYEFVPLQSNP